MSEKRTGAQIMCEVLIRNGVDVMFGIPGGAIMPFYYAMWEYRDQLRHVLCRHEQGGGHAAEGYARATGKLGVCIGTSGPGATNLVTAIADAMMDSTPLLAITGQVGSHVLGKDAFQETDITGITMPITKHNYLVKRVEDIAYTMSEAITSPQPAGPGRCSSTSPRTRWWLRRCQRGSSPSICPATSRPTRAIGGKSARRCGC